MSIFTMRHLNNSNESEIFQIKKKENSYLGAEVNNDIIYVLTIDEYFGFNLYRYVPLFSNLINKHDLHLPASELKKRNDEYKLGLTHDYIDSIYEKAKIDSQLNVINMTSNKTLKI